MRTKLLLAAMAVTASGLWMIHAQDNRSHFTGGDPTPLEEKPQGNIAHYRFAPGSRSRWHTHDGGQIILQEEGIGLAQVRGGSLIELHAGDTLWCPPGVEHWHGGAPDKGGVQYNISRGGIKWLDDVSEKDYTAKPTRK